MKYGWQRMRTVKVKRSAGICAKYWALIRKQPKRIVFHEITKPAIKAAVENPRTVGYEPGEWPNRHAGYWTGSWVLN